MALKALIDKASYDKLPDLIKAEYTDSGDGNFVLAVDDKDYHSKIKEFRDNNISFKKQMDKLNADIAKFKDIDPDAYKDAMDAKAKLEELEASNLAKAGNIDEYVAKRTETMRLDYEKKLKQRDELYSKADADAKKYRESLRSMRIDGTIRDAVAKVGSLRAGAIDHVLRMARDDWQLDDNDELVAPDKFDDKSQPMSTEFWAKKLLADHGYLFEASQGGGAQGGRPGGAPRQGGKVLHNPSAHEFGKNLEDIAKGKTEVVLTQG